MKVLYIIKKEPTDTTQNMIDTHKKQADVTVIDMREDKDYEKIIDQVFDHDKVVTW